MASIDKRPDGRYRARWREVPGRRSVVAGLALSRPARDNVPALAAG